MHPYLHNNNSVTTKRLIGLKRQNSSRIDKLRPSSSVSLGLFTFYFQMQNYFTNKVDQSLSK